MRFIPKKNTWNLLRVWYLFWKGFFFLWTTFSGRGQNILSSQKWEFFWAQNLGFWPKIPIFAIWFQFFDFSFLRYGCFCKKKRLTRKKVFPLPTVGTPSASNSSSALSAQALQARARGWIKRGAAKLPFSTFGTVNWKRINSGTGVLFEPV